MQRDCFDSLDLSACFRIAGGIQLKSNRAVQLGLSCSRSQLYFSSSKAECICKYFPGLGLNKVEGTSGFQILGSFCSQTFHSSVRKEAHQQFYSQLAGKGILQWGGKMQECREKGKGNFTRKVFKVLLFAFQQLRAVGSVALSQRDLLLVLSATYGNSTLNI